jgi:DNA invertase Pin-like site-specific DNA recombinase/HPt (histidine-containing phosphotransfer) domain-containing protein
MKCAAYARYSSDLQSAASTGDQLRACKSFILRQGWTCVEAYKDQALSGASALRPGYQKLLEGARNGGFEVVVAEALDRLSRDQADVANLYKHLSFLGIKLVTLAEGEINEMHVGLKGTMNALFLKDLAQKTRRGLEGRVRQGKSAGGLCYGYKTVEGKIGERRIDLDEATVIRRIFIDFAKGKSPRSIACALNAEDIPGPHGRQWRDTALRGHLQRGTGLINNELYKGRLVWNRLRYIKGPETGKRVSRRNPESDWIVEEVPHLRIVDDDLWQAVKVRQGEIATRPGVQKIKDSRFWERRRARHLLTGLVFCGDCGGGFAAVGRDYLACSAARGRGTCANRRSIRRHDLETVILDGLKARLMAPDLVAEFIAAFTQEINSGRAAADQARKRQEQELAGITRKLDGLIEAIAEGFRAEGLQQKLTEFEARKIELVGLLAGPAAAPIRLHPNLAEVYRRKVCELEVALADPEIRDEALAILRPLIDKAMLHPIDGGFEIELVGEIVGMVALGQETPKSITKTAALDAGTACSVKVVAGVRNRLYLLFDAPRLGR